MALELPPDARTSAFQRQGAVGISDPPPPPSYTHLFCVIGAGTGDKSASSCDSRWGGGRPPALGRPRTDPDNRRAPFSRRRTSRLREPCSRSQPTMRPGQTIPGGQRPRTRGVHRLPAPRRGTSGWSFRLPDPDFSGWLCAWAEAEGPGARPAPIVLRHSGVGSPHLPREPPLILRLLKYSPEPLSKSNCHKRMLRRIESRETQSAACACGGLVRVPAGVGRAMRRPA